MTDPTKPDLAAIIETAREKLRWAMECDVDAHTCLKGCQEFLYDHAEQILSAASASLAPGLRPEDSALSGECFDPSHSTLIEGVAELRRVLRALGIRKEGGRWWKPESRTGWCSFRLPKDCADIDGDHFHPILFPVPGLDAGEEGK